MKKGPAGGEGEDRKEMSGIVSSAIPVILPIVTSVENAGRRSLVATVVSMGAGGKGLTSVNGAMSGIATSVAGQTSWIGAVVEIVGLQNLVVTQGIRSQVVAGINTAVIEEMETGTGVTEVEAEIIVVIGGATGEEEGTVNGMCRVKEGGKSCERFFIMLKLGHRYILRAPHLSLL